MFFSYFPNHTPSKPSEMDNYLIIIDILISKCTYLMKKGHLSKLIGCFLARAISQQLLSVPTDHPVEVTLLNIFLHFFWKSFFNLLKRFGLCSCKAFYNFPDEDLDKYSLSLNFETESKTEILWVSISRPRLKFYESQFWDRVRDWIYQRLNMETESETEIIWVSASRPSPRP